MIQEETINVATELRGMDVISSETAEKLGIVADAIVHPTRGVLLGITLRTAGGEVERLAARRLLIGRDAVLARGAAALEGADDEGEENDQLQGGVYVCRELIGVSIVTEDGELLGRICDVYLVRAEACALYRIAPSPWSRLFRGGFFLRGDAARAWSRLGVRLIVPAETTRRLAVSSLESATRGGARRD